MVNGVSCSFRTAPDSLFSSYEGTLACLDCTHPAIEEHIGETRTRSLYSRSCGGARPLFLPYVLDRRCPRALRRPPFAGEHRGSGAVLSLSGTLSGLVCTPGPWTPGQSPANSGIGRPLDKHRAAALKSADWFSVVSPCPLAIFTTPIDSGIGSVRDVCDLLSPRLIQCAALPSTFRFPLLLQTISKGGGRSRSCASLCNPRLWNGPVGAVRFAG